MIKFKQKGVGLVEGIVAIAILVTGIVAIVSLAQSNLINSNGMETRIVAVNLAREGLEVVRSLRDDNWLKGRVNVTGGRDPNTGQPNAWDTGLENGEDATAIAMLNKTTLAWTLDFSVNSINDSAAKMRRDAARSLYVQSASGLQTGETNTIFSRLVTIYAICMDSSGKKEYGWAVCPGGWEKAGLRVISRVEWAEGGNTRSLEVEDWLYNWRYSFTPYAQ